MITFSQKRKKSIQRKKNLRWGVRCGWLMQMVKWIPFSLLVERNINLRSSFSSYPVSSYFAVSVGRVGWGVVWLCSLNRLGPFYCKVLFLSVQLSLMWVKPRPYLSLMHFLQQFISLILVLSASFDPVFADRVWGERSPGPSALFWNGK